MILSTSVINWASVRSGMSMGEFMASLTPEREREILASYNAWRRGKGLPEAQAVAPPEPSPAPQQSATDDSKRGAAGDDIAQMMVEYAREAEQEEAEEAALIEQTMEQIDSMSIETVPSEAIPAEIKREMDEDARTSEDDSAPEDGTASTEAEAKSDEPATPEAMDAPGSRADTATEEALYSRLCAIARTLPKEPDAALYASVLRELEGSADAVKRAAEAVKRQFSAKHRSTVAIRAFLTWLEG